MKKFIKENKIIKINTILFLISFALLIFCLFVPPVYRFPEDHSRWTQVWINFIYNIYDGWFLIPYDGLWVIGIGSIAFFVLFIFNIVFFVKSIRYLKNKKFSLCKCIIHQILYILAVSFVLYYSNWSYRNFDRPLWGSIFNVIVLSLIICLMVYELIYTIVHSFKTKNQSIE